MSRPTSCSKTKRRQKGKETFRPSGREHVGIGDGIWPISIFLFTPSTSLPIQAMKKLPGTMIPLPCLKKAWAGGTQNTA